MDDWLTTNEVARLLRMRPRSVYHLVSRGAIPHARARGKLLFSRAQIGQWVAAQAVGTIESKAGEPPPLIAGSHDPLLEWAARESRCGLALAALGSVDGLDRFVSRNACASLIHIPNASDDGFNDDAFNERLASLPVVALHWARREQGLILARGNPLRVRSLAALARARPRFALRHAGAGSQLLLARLVREAGVSLSALRSIGPLASSETEVAQAVALGYADAGFGVRAAAVAQRLSFVPLAWESVDLVLWRRSAFEPPAQALLAFARTRRFARQAAVLGGYDVSRCGEVRFNA